MATRKTSTRRASPPIARPSTPPVAKTRPAAADPVRPALVAPAGAAEPAAALATKPAERRPRLVRDGFTMPEDDFALIAALKGRAMSARREAKKSELLRAGLHALMALDPAALVAALQRLQPLKVGRPKKGH
jgi:hypothetical protein